ncbi:MAG: hypothetical protein EMLJLAPB_00254 [Candidatus Argoarchaeum ethanivorans]|uniref:PEF-CTERM protein sorting domain-containing protein n=1 Tax=Candidatus Argoarchaeum ethanivorans TaxID=2608793 RepID=A0A811T7J7_9EURY|nr:MAG: hypothetical protein EMLJLAPB_00254 [Candidatus Argoarchaeum ethanivorans]
MNRYKEKIAMVFVLSMAVFTVMTGTTVAPPAENMSATMEGECINATAWDFSFNGDKYYQFRYYEPGTSYANGDSYFNSTIWLANKNSPPHTEYFNVVSSGATNTTGEWTVWLFKGGSANSNPTDAITSERVSATVDVPIPEFTTIAIPVIAILGFFALCRRKQKK